MDRQYQDISTYLCDWYKQKKMIPPIELSHWPRTIMAKSSQMKS
jgi:hypothetical protein